MKPFSFFRKPDWQSADAERRARAVAQDDVAELISALPRLAQDDPDAGVRRQALRRCDDPALYARAARTDADASLRTWARQQWLAAIETGRHPCGETDLQDMTAAELERLASVANDHALRQRLLATITRPAFLAERALADPSADIRAELIDRLDNPATLDRLAEQLRRKDKRLYRAAQERAQALRLASGDPATRASIALAICEELETLIRAPIDVDHRRQQMTQAAGRWAALDPETLPDQLRTRFDGACAVLQTQLNPPAPLPARIEPEPPVTAPPAPTPEEVAAQARLEAQIARNLAEREQEQKLEREKAEQERQAQIARQRENSVLIEQLADVLDRGELSRARELAQTIDSTCLSTAAQRRWNDLQPALKELQGWESWASNKVRARLCADVERLIGSGLHPDAISTRIQEIQQQWRELDAAEGRDDTSPPSGLDKRLRVACARALKPAREFFDKRKELRNEQRDAITAFLTQADGLMAGGDAAIDTPQLLSLQKQAVDHLRSLDTLVGGERKRLGQRLRDLLDSLKPRIEAEFLAVESAKQRLIDAAQALAASETDRRKVAGEARTLNERWKQAGRGRTGRDQHQWRQFRAALDQAFGNLDRQRQAQADEQRQRHEQAEALVLEVEALARLEGAELADSDASVRSLRERWSALAVRETALADRYDSALTLHREAVKAWRLEQRRERLLALLDAAAASAPADAPSGDATIQALALVFEAEAGAGIEPPDEEREQRRQWQLQRLQDRLRGGPATAGFEATMQTVLGSWRELAPRLESGLRDRYGERLRQAILRFKPD